MLFLLALLACKDEPVEPAPIDLGDAPPVESPEPTLRRLTEVQYTYAVKSLLGDDIVVSTALEPDQEVEGLLSLGNAIKSTSPLGVERYETAALSIAEQAFADGASFALPCSPTGPTDEACAEQFVTEVGRQAWRRPLDTAEIEVLTDLVTGIGTEAGDFTTGAKYTLAAILQSPNFVYRVEQGEAGEDGHRKLTSYELASRLSFFLWSEPPDEALLAAAENGDLDTPEGLAAIVDEMIQDERVRQGTAAYFNEALELYELEHMEKDSLRFPSTSKELWVSAREQTLRTLDTHIYTLDGDYRDLFTARWTWVDRQLAALYEIPAPDIDGFALTNLPDDGRRRGLLGHASMLALHSHSTRSSPTLRGVFVRMKLLCQTIPPPPANVDTSIPEPDTEAPTMRDRLMAHQENPVCASCHIMTDNVGLALENFDGIGKWRDTQAGTTIDASGDLDGDTYPDAWGLARAVADHPDLGPCLTERLYSYGTGHLPEEGEDEMLAWLASGFALQDYSVKTLLRDVALSPGFQTVGELQ